MKVRINSNKVGDNNSKHSSIGRAYKKSTASTTLQLYRNNGSAISKPITVVFPISTMANSVATHQPSLLPPDLTPIVNSQQQQQQQRLSLVDASTATELAGGYPATAEANMEILPIPMIGSSFLFFCLVVLSVSLYYHCRSADRRHASWLRTKPRSVAALTASGPGLVTVIADNYEYTCSQVKHQTSSRRAIDDVSPNNAPQRSHSLLTKFKQLSRSASKNSERDKNNQSARLLETNIISLTTLDTSGLSYSANNNNNNNSDRIGSPMRIPPSTSGNRSYLATAEIDDGDIAAIEDDGGILSSANLRVTRLHSDASRHSTSSGTGQILDLQHQVSITSYSGNCTLDLPADLDASYWSYGSATAQAAQVDHRRLSVCSATPGAETLEASSGSEMSSALLGSDNVRRLAFKKYHQPSVDSRASVVSGISTNSAVSNLQVPTPSSPCQPQYGQTGRESPSMTLARQNSLRRGDSAANLDPPTALMPRGKTYTGLLSLTRLNTMIKSRHEMSDLSPTVPHRKIPIQPLYSVGAVTSYQQQQQQHNTATTTPMTVSYPSSPGFYNSRGGPSPASSSTALTKSSPTTPSNNVANTQM